ncbi:MAG: CBS domain-containing protein [Clostridia bacterium]|nr:CBS domain-containing protein [Clostridia bacterium]MBR3806124.1 CBS domain-containing protein [Clostridia bacterium]
MNILRFMVPKSLVEYLTEDLTFRQALEKMRYHRYAAIPVLDSDGRYVGTLRNDDVLRFILELSEFSPKAAEKISLSSLMDSKSVKPVYHNASMQELIEQIKEHNFVPVVDDRGCFIGIILRRDVLNYLLDFYNENDGGNQ